VCKPGFHGDDCSLDNNDPAYCAKQCTIKCIKECKDVYTDVMAQLQELKMTGSGLDKQLTQDEIKEQSTDKSLACIKACDNPCLDKCMVKQVTQNPTAMIIGGIE